VEIPWVLSRLRPAGRVLEVGYAFAEPAYLAGLLRAGVDVVGADLAVRDVEMETVQADVRSLPFPDGSFDQVLLVSTLEHVGADNSVYGLDAERGNESQREEALRELARVLGRNGTLLVTVPLGEPGDHGWFRQEDEGGWTSLFARADLFVEELELYELTAEGWRAAPSFRSDGVRYGERGPAASAVLCAELSSGRLRRLLSPGGARVATRRRAARTYRRVRPRDLE